MGAPRARVVRVDAALENPFFTGFEAQALFAYDRRTFCFLLFRDDLSRKRETAKNYVKYSGLIVIEIDNIATDDTDVL